MRSGCDQPEIRHTTGRFSPFEGDIINEFLGSSAAVVSGGLGFNSRIAVFVFLFLFGFCVFLFLFWSWVLGSNPAQCASWCFVFAVFLISFLAASLSSWGAPEPEQQTGQTRCGRLWWSWVQLPDRCFGVLVLFWFCVFLFLLWSWVQIPSSALRGVFSLLRGCLCFVLMKPG